MGSVFPGLTPWAMGLPPSGLAVEDTSREMCVRGWADALGYTPMPLRWTRSALTSTPGLDDPAVPAVHSLVVHRRILSRCVQRSVDWQGCGSLTTDVPAGTGWRAVLAGLSAGDRSQAPASGIGFLANPERTSGTWY